MNWEEIRKIHTWLPWSSDGFAQHPNGGGVIHGGVIRGGVIHGGVIRDGEINCGVVRKSPLLVTELLPWPCSASGPNMLSIGCRSYTIAKWKRDLEDIAMEHQMTKHVDVIRRFVIPMFAEWFRDHPDAITETVA